MSDKKHGIIDADYAALEKRLLAVYESMPPGFYGVKDFWKVKAAELFGIEYDAVTAEQRDAAKKLGYMDAYMPGKKVQP